MENNNTNLQLNEQPTSQTPSSPTRKSKFRQSVAAVLASAQTLVPSAATTAGLAGGAAMLASCETEQVDPVNPISNELTPQQKLFASAFDVNNTKLIERGWVKPSILDGKPVVTVPVNPKPNNLAFTEAFQGFMDIEIRLVNAKTGEYSITPIIHRSSIEKIIEKGKELVPGKDLYGMSLVSEALNGDLKRNLTTGVEILDRRDPNPAVRAPYVAQLPERFTMEEFRKYYTNGNTLTSSFVLSRSESMRMIMDLATIGEKFDTIYYPVKPADEAMSVVQD